MTHYKAVRLAAAMGHKAFRGMQSAFLVNHFKRRCRIGKVTLKQSR